MDTLSEPYHHHRPLAHCEARYNEGFSLSNDLKDLAIAHATSRCRQTSLVDPQTLKYLVIYHIYHRLALSN